MESAGSPSPRMGRSSGRITRWRRSGITRIMRIMSGPRMPQSQSALTAVSDAAANQNPARFSMVSYRYSMPSPMSSVNSTFSVVGARNSPYGTCDTRANTSSRDA